MKMKTKVLLAMVMAIIIIGSGSASADPVQQDLHFYSKNPAFFGAGIIVIANGERLSPFMKEAEGKIGNDGRLTLNVDMNYGEMIVVVDYKANLGSKREASKRASFNLPDLFGLAGGMPIEVQLYIDKRLRPRWRISPIKDPGIGVWNFTGEWRKFLPSCPKTEICDVIKVTAQKTLYSIEGEDKGFEPSNTEVQFSLPEGGRILIKTRIYSRPGKEFLLVESTDYFKIYLSQEFFAPGAKVMTIFEMRYGGLDAIEVSSLPE